MFGNALYVFGGYNFQTSTSLSDAWSSADGGGSAMPWGMRSSMAVVVQPTISSGTSSRMVLIGGNNGAGGHANDVWVTGVVWTPCGPLNSGFAARQNHGAAVMNGKIVGFGGQSVSSNAYGGMWISSTACPSWSLVPGTGAHPTARTSFPMVSFRGSLYVFGGVSASLAPTESDRWISTDEGSSWHLAPQPTPAGMVGRALAMAVDHGAQRVQWAGGYLSGVVQNDVWSGQ